LVTVDFFQLREEWILQQLGGRISGRWLHHEHFNYEALGLFRDMVRELELSAGYLLVEVFIVLAFKRELAA
jgi:hypothetical protein